MSYEYRTTDTLGRDVFVSHGPFLTEKTTVDGGGNCTTKKTLFDW